MARRFVALVDALSQGAGLVFQYLILGIIGVVVCEVFMRFVLHSPTVWAERMTEMFFGTHLVMGGCYVLMTNRHIRVDVLRDRLNPKTGAIVDVATSVLFFMFAGFLVWYGARFAWQSISIWEIDFGPFNPPLWPFKSTLFIGGLLLFLQGVANLIRNVGIIRGSQMTESSRGRHDTSES
jgi:TRAP-type mannitol/chloroaromatic compound transport system permease small subunit